MYELNANGICLLNCIVKGMERACFFFVRGPDSGVPFYSDNLHDAELKR